MAATHETARVLRPGGLLAIAWHVRDESVPWVRELSLLTHDRADRDEPPPPLPGPPAFEPVEEAVFRYAQTLTAEELVTLASSWSYVAVRPDRERVLAEVAALGRRVAGPGGRIVVPHDTRCFRAVRVADRDRL
jgi:hypothetical protein